MKKHAAFLSAILGTLMALFFSCEQGSGLIDMVPPTQEINPAQGSVPAYNPIFSEDAVSATVSFDSGSGSFYRSSGLITKDRIQQTVKVGDKLTRPADTAYLEGARFLGYTRIWNENPSKVIFWDFDNDVATENDRWGFTLWAVYEEDSGTPDAPPAADWQGAGHYGSSPDSIHYTDSRYPPVDLSDRIGEGQTLTLFADGVTASGGWFNEPQYANNCWATAAAQAIYVYQQNLLKHTQFDQTERPIGLLGGKNRTGNAAITELRDHFLDGRGQRGYDVTPAIDSYFSQFLSSGRRGDWTTYSSGGVSSPYSLETLSGILYRHLTKGDICAFEGNQGGLHAMNIYGAEFDRNGIIVTLYATSSPTYGNDAEYKSHKPQLMHAKPLYYTSGALGWRALIEVRGETYVSTQESKFERIYELHFLSTSRYKGAQK